MPACPICKFPATHGFQGESRGKEKAPGEGAASERIVALDLVFVVLEADFELLKGFVGRSQRFHAMPAKIVRWVFHVLFGAPQGFDGFVNLRVPLGCAGTFRRRDRRQLGHCLLVGSGLGSAGQRENNGHG